MPDGTGARKSSAVVKGRAMGLASAIKALYQALLAYTTSLHTQQDGNAGNLSSRSGAQHGSAMVTTASMCMHTCKGACERRTHAGLAIDIA